MSDKNRENARITLSLGIVAAELAIITIPEFEIVSSWFQQFVLWYFCMYIITTIFLLQYDDGSWRKTKALMDALRKDYFDLGVLMLFMNFWGISWTLLVSQHDFSPIISTILLLIPILLIFALFIIGKIKSKKRGKHENRPTKNPHS